MTYLWRIPDDYPQSMIGEYERDGTPDRFIFKRGEEIREFTGLPRIKFAVPCARLREFDCLSSNAQIPIVSPALGAALLEIAPHDVQLINLTIEGADGQIEDYCLLNVIRKIFCIDHKASKYTLIPGTTEIMGFRQLSLVSKCLKDHSLARDSEYLSHLLVSDQARENLLHGGFRGLAFINPVDVIW